MKDRILRMQSWFGIVDEDAYLAMSLKMILLLLLLFVDDIPLYGVLVPLMAVPGLLLRKILFNRFYWTMIAIVFTVFYLVLGLRIYLPNHHYIFAFTIIMATLVVYSRYYEADWKNLLAVSARYIIGFCFLFATIGKFLAPEFLNGAFFEFTCLTDGRFHGTTSMLTDIPIQTLFQGYDRFMNLLAGDCSGDVSLVSSPNLRYIALFLAYWTIFIEGMLAITFLAPQKSWLHRNREWFLLCFIFTTYPIATVPGFATLLAGLAFAQAYKVGKPNAYAFVYLLIFIAVPLFKIPFLRIIRLITQQ
jgi:hypothetical protein